MTNQYPKPPPMPRVHIDLDSLRGDHELGRLARLWFELGWPSVGGWLRDQLTAQPLPDSEVTADLLQAVLHKHYPAEGQPFLLLGGRTGDGTEQNWNRLYCDAAFRDFLAMAAKAPSMASMISGGIIQSDDPLLPPRSPGAPYFNMDFFRGPNPYWASLGLSAARAFLSDDEPRQEELLKFLRRFADESDLVYGECGLPKNLGHTVIAEQALPRGLAGLQAGRSVLRGFSWLTMVPKELSTNLGGTEGLRGTGAFAEVNELRNGGLWLLATQRLGEFDNAAARRVFEALEAVLPSGMRDVYDRFEDSFSWPGEHQLDDADL